MNGNAARFLRLGVSLAGLVTLGWVLTGQAAKPVHHAVSLPTDWSHRHLIFSQPRSAEQAARVSQDPRYMQQVYRRQQRLALPVALPDAAGGVQSSSRPGSRKKVMSQSLKRDWSQSLGSGGSMGADQFPAKFTFDTTIAFCDAALPPNQPDYAVYSTGLTASVNQASVVAFDNLYFGCGGGPTPLVYWAYNAGAGTKVKTSPVLSLDGKQVAFVETLVPGGPGILVTLRWKAADGTVAAPSSPALVPTTVGCTAPCMTLTALKAGGGIIQTDDTTSSVYYDYTNDVAWVGDGSGWLHKFTTFFNGAPTEVTTGAFPVQVNPGNPFALSSPVYDRITDSVFVGDLGGTLYRVSATGAVTASGQLDFGTGIVDGPIVDSSNGFVYVFASSDGTGNCTLGADCAAVFQLSTAFSAGDVGSNVTVGNSTVGGVGTNPLYVGGFDSAYYDSVSPNAATGNLYVCGNTGGPATLYQVPISAGHLPGTGLGFELAALATTGSTAACSPITDVPNENLPGGFSERAFVSVQDNGLSSTCLSGGCVLNFVSAPWVPFNIYSVGQQVLSSRGHVETVIQAGVSARINAPTWSTRIGDTRTDGNPGSDVIWIDQGLLDAPFLGWNSSFHYAAVNRIKILDPAGNVQALTTNLTTGGIEPTWNPTPGGTTTDNTSIWTNVGPIGTAALPAAGGTSGIIIDNTVGTITVVGGSQIYFSTLSNQLCDFGQTGGCAVQASQPALK